MGLGGRSDEDNRRKRAMASITRNGRISLDLIRQFEKEKKGKKKIQENKKKELNNRGEYVKLLYSLCGPDKYMRDGRGRNQAVKRGDE